MAYQLLNPLTLLPLVVITILMFAGTPKRLQSAIALPLRVPRPKWQCHLSDLYVLVFQFGIAGLMTYETDEEFGPVWALGGLAVLWSLQAYVWYMAIRSLSWNQINDPLRRLQMLGIAFPLMIFFPLMSCMAPMMCVFPVLAAILPAWAYQKIMPYFAAWAYKPVSVQSRWRRVAWVLTLALSLVAVPLATWPMWSGYSMPPVYYKIHVRRFRKEMQQTADIPAIQAWLKTPDAANYMDRDVPLSAQPSCVSSIAGHAYLCSPGRLLIYQGSGFGHWGLEVAALGTAKSSQNYSLPLADGAWVWIDDH